MATTNWSSRAHVMCARQIDEKAFNISLGFRYDSIYGGIDRTDTLAKGLQK